MAWLGYAWRMMRGMNDVLKKAHNARFKLVEIIEDDTGGVEFKVEPDDTYPTVYAKLRTTGELRAWLEGVEYGRKEARSGKEAGNDE